jgi:Na+/proline symporter
MWWPAWEKLYGIIIAAVVVTLYFSAGGIKSAAIVNIIELIVILLGFCVATPFALQYVGAGKDSTPQWQPHMDTALLPPGIFPGTAWGVRPSWGIS